jgi:hypothetical protein
MNKLIILSYVSMNEPTKECHFEFYLSDKQNLSKKIDEIKKRIIDENIEDWNDLEFDEECPYYDGYINPNYKKYSRIEGSFLPLGDDEVFLIENHTSYIYAYAITVRNFTDNNTFDFYEH